MRYTLETCVDSSGFSAVVNELAAIARDKAKRARRLGDSHTAEVLEADAEQLEDAAEMPTTWTFDETLIERR
jgi:hypothetical protein